IKKITYSVQNEKEKRTTNGNLDFDALYYSIEAISQLKMFCSVRGINLLVAIYRDGDFYRQPAWFANYERAVSSSLNTIGVDHFVLRWATERLSRRQFSVSWNDDMHPSAVASQIIASEIAAELGRRGY